LRATDSASEYDYVVVGGGSAGCAVATRLAERGASVILLEAGGSDRGIQFRLPAAVLQLQLTSEHDWAFPGEPDSSRNGRAEGWASGKVLGGSGSINGMVWVRGHPADFDSWATIGCHGWDYATVLEHFKRTETYLGGGDSAFRGRSGPLLVQENTFHHPLTDAFLEAAEAAGHALNPDYNGERMEGAGRTQYNIGHGLRSSTSRAFLRRARRVPGFRLTLDALATRVLFEGGRAAGVEYMAGGQTRIAHAAREVVLSAGAINSPKLLMLSGIGPATQLRRHGIEVVHDSPNVGRRLADHIALSMSYEVDVRSLNAYFTPGRMIRAGGQWVLTRGGPLAAGPAHATLNARLGASGPPDYLVHLLPFALPGLEKGRSVSKLVDSWGQFWGMTLVTLGLHPHARGEVLLRSADPTDPPMIRLVQLADPSDIRLMRTAIEATSELAAQTPLARRIVRRVSPGPYVDTEGMEEHLRTHTHRGLHPTGTCAMGAGPDAVVDPMLRVNGVERLRVIDASIMPSIPSGNTNAAAVMIGERGAALALED
jgi:choline dehydrogenase